jgi:hypothetical protein
VDNCFVATGRAPHATTEIQSDHVVVGADHGQSSRRSRDNEFRPLGDTETESNALGSTDAALGPKANLTSRVEVIAVFGKVLSVSVGSSLSRS